VEVKAALDVPARMRDGVMLRANVYRPGGSASWPTLLTRTPYGKDLPGLSWCGLDPVQAARRGFMVVVMDTRGRFASEGSWEPFQHERADGYDSVEWAAALPGSTGRVGMFGGSYWGSTQWLAAIERPPSLAAISPAMTWSDPLDGLLGRGGAVELGLGLWWSLLTGFDRLDRLAIDATERRARVEALVDEYDPLAERGYRELPVAEGDVLRRHGTGDLGGIRAPLDPSVARPASVVGLHHRVEVPSLSTGGWYDGFLQGTLDNHQAMVAEGVEAKLVVGPWSHTAFADPIGERTFGLRAQRDGVAAHPQGDWGDLQLAWMRRHLLPEPPIGEPADAPVRLYVMGRDEWRDESAWPLARARTELWFLGAGGVLRPGEPGPPAPPTEFDYDPGDPVPTHGGHTVMIPAFPAGPCDQARVEARRDVCVFTSAPLRGDLEVTGRVRVVLHAESSAPSTDWVARLCDVHPDGRSLNLCDGILRVAQGAQACRRLELDLWSTSNVFLAGHRLRVHVTSSSFPRWDRNLNTGRQDEPRHEVARQRLHHDAERPSHLELPVVTGGPGPPR
jgi:hypothetical protein